METTSGPLAAVEEDALIRRAREGDREAFGELYTRYAVPVRKMVVSIAGPTPELDDLSQEAFLAAFRAMPTFRGASRFSTWLFRIVVHTVAGALRRPRRLVLMPTEACEAAAMDSCDIDTAVAAREMVRRVYRILDEMSVKRRLALTLFEFQGLSLAEMSGVLQVPATVIKSRLFFARQELRRRAGADSALGPLLEEILS